jgi:hypothetical protein
MAGVLRRGSAADLSVMPGGQLGLVTPFPAGGSIIFTLAGTDPHAVASFYITESTHEAGVREPDGRLRFVSGLARISVARLAD